MPTGIRLSAEPKVVEAFKEGLTAEQYAKRFKRNKPSKAALERMADDLGLRLETTRDDGRGRVMHYRLVEPKRRAQASAMNGEFADASEDERDAAIARKRLAEIAAKPESLVKGAELDQRLAAAMGGWRYEISTGRKSAASYLTMEDAATAVLHHMMLAADAGAYPSFRLLPPAE